MPGSPVPEANALPTFLEDGAAWACYAALQRRRGAIADAAKRKLLSGTETDEAAVAALLSQVPTWERASCMAELKILSFSFTMRNQGKCERCMFTEAYCICAQLATLAAEPSAQRAACRVRFVVWMHQLERGRASNTGKLLEHLLPGSIVLFADAASHAERLRKIVAQSSGRVVVLFPSENAVSVEEAIRILPTTASMDSSMNNEGSGPPPLVAVLVDGTWKQAKRMHRTLADLPHVALAPRGRSEFHWRRQSQEGRISTVEAAALFLEELGETPNGAPKILRCALHELVEALEQQCHYDGFRTGPAPPEPSPAKRALLKLRLPKRGPGFHGPGSV
eukprot:CAMPEP_0172723576 /NCGR_PEP_ID=MMETSP1074-20121228/84042_1 /TAXON_ID=2916 /ORGANISM="Ceratium fusus, Strain PA161109" /LENGTH=335 /DNA_ID=CAMNT_0013549849 /DNA_START=88 /DNA_END=1095 /DNA_ORIENTATION=+